MHKQGQVIWTSYTASVLRATDGAPMYFIYQLQNITARKAAEEALQASEAHFRATFEQAAVGIAHIGPDGRWLRVNQRLCAILGYTREELARTTFHALTHPDDRDVQLSAVHGLLAGDRVSHIREKRFLRKGGALVWVQVTVSAVRDVPNAAPYLVAVVEDIGERKRIQEQLAHLAEHDTLTGLANRLAFRVCLRQGLEKAERERGALALFLLDLNGFKEVNDTYGHETGDLVLQEVGTRLHDALHTTDTVARLGGDEFAVVLPGTGAAGAMFVARKLLERLAAPVAASGVTCDIGASIGIALFPEHGRDPDSLVRRADSAMYEAKRAGDGYRIAQMQ